MQASLEPSAGPGRRERNKRDKQRRITRAARALFEQRGFEGATARAIARRADVGTGTLFLYARDKRDLLFLVFQEDARRLFEEGMAHAGPGAALADALMGLFGRFVEYYAANPDLSRAIVQELFFREHDPERMGALTLEYASCVADLVERARRSGEIRSAQPTDAIAAAFFAHYSFWMQAWLGTRLVDASAARAGLRNAIQLQIEGLRP